MLELKQAISLLDLIINDRTIPKNIRKAAEDSKNILTSENVDEVKISTALSILDEVTNDPNMPVYARTKIWNVVSILEQLRKK
jgi:uncharacterized protein (UPF0147 family)